MLQLLLVLAGFVSEVVAWRLVASGRFSVWTLTTPLFAVLGLTAALVRPPVASGRADVGTAGAAGAAAGVALYLATLAFVAFASRWAAFREHVADGYERARQLSPAVAISLGVLVAVPGEELFWRGLVQPRLQASLPVLSGPALAWAAYVVANASSGSLPFAAGAVVGGAVWAALALWTKGVLASVVCHGAWTALMLSRPPGPGREMMRA